MTVPTVTEIIETAEAGKLLDAIFERHWAGELQEKEPLAQMLATAHNDGLIDVLAPLNVRALARYSGYPAINGRQTYERLLSKLNVSGEAILGALETLYGAEPFSHGADVSLSEWCGAHPQRPIDLLELVARELPSATKYQALRIGIRSGLNSDEDYFVDHAIRFSREGIGTQKAEVARSLYGYLFKGQTHWRAVVGAMSTALEDLDDDPLRCAILRTALSWLRKTPEDLGDDVEELIRTACVPFTSEIAYTVCYALAFDAKSLSWPDFKCLLDRLLDAKLEPKAVGVLDLALSNLLSNGHAGEVRNFLRGVLLRTDATHRLSEFQAVVSKISASDTGALNDWVIDWLRSGDPTLCMEVSESIFEPGVEHVFDIDFSAYDLKDWEVGFVARKAIAYFFNRHGTLGSFLASLARVANGHEHPVLTELIFEPVLLNYPSLADTDTSFDAIANDPNDPGRVVIKNALEQLKRYLDELGTIEMIAELRPSEREVQLEFELRTEKTTRAMRDASENSLMAQLGAVQRILLYGDGMVSWHNRHDMPGNSPGGLSRVAQPLTTVMHRVHLPREDFLHPLELRELLLSYKRERRPV